MKDTLLGIFLTQADSTLAVFGDSTSTQERRKRELEDLAGAAELSGNTKLEGRVAALIKRLSDGEGLDELEALVAELVPAEAVDGAIEKATPRPEPPLGRAESSSDTSETRVQKTPRQRASKFDTSEHMTLLTFFQEEAREGLDRITSLLLAADLQKPDDEATSELMRLTHGLKGAAGTVDLPTVAALTHDFEGAFESIRKNAMEWSAPLRDQLVDVADRLRLVIFDGAEPYESMADVDEVKSLLANLGRAGRVPVRAGAPLIVSESHTTESYAERRRPERRGTHSQVLRVDPARIDRLMNSVGELVFDRTRIEKRLSELSSELAGIRGALDSLSAQRASWGERGIAVRSEHLAAALSELETSLGDSLPQIDKVLDHLKSDTALLRRTEFALQDGLTGVRMQSVRSIFQRLTPQLRSIARQADKQVRLATAGGETEFDKTVADQMVDPLIQLLRNAVAHGIESPKLRELRGKSAEGRITVTARHEANVVVLEVSDDGGGIDVVALRQRFVENGEWSATKAEQASDERVLERIFDAGFSSRDNADQLAGRGVGLSSVRETVTKLGGEVLVSTVPQRGTTFTMRLPLTTAIANALLFKVGGHVFAIPNVHVVDHGTIDLPLQRNAEDQEAKALPLVPLHELLGFDIPSNVAGCPIVVIEYLGKRLAISCDRIVGPREIVVKNLGPLLAGIPLYAGATISPSGKVQLILDPAALANIASPHETRARATSLADTTIDKAPPLPSEKTGPVAKRVLVVDDSRAIREAMRHMLQRAGYQVLTASDGLSAWHCILEQGCDVLVTDLEMPGETGFQLLGRLRADERFATLPAVVISSKASEQNRKEAGELGAADFLPKPVSQRDLVDALRAAQRQR